MENEEFKNKCENPANESELGLFTSDGQKVEQETINCIMMILADCHNEKMEEYGIQELITRLAENFIKANTVQDIEKLLVHHLTLNLMRVLTK